MPPQTNLKELPSSTVKEKVYAKAIAIVDQERVNWEDAVTFVTPRVAFRMRELIRILRKNFWGVFDEPIDPQTSREKIFIGLIMSTVETWVKNIDIDQKDLNFIARDEDGYDITELTRLKTKDYLDRMYFGETLDEDERQVCIDGTVVWKTWESSFKGTPVMNRRTVDLLNFYIDPTEQNIQSAYRVTERAILLPEQIEAMTGWYNTDDLPGSQILNRIDGSRRSNFGTRMTGSFRDVWECWGKAPKWIIPGYDCYGKEDADDANEEIDAHIVVSGLEAPKPTCHLIEENTKADKFGNILKPYEEWRPAKISGRWYGLGPAERILALQEYLNTIVNIRINRSYISQLGLFKIKKGRGITAQMLSRLPVNGGIQVQDQDDVQQFNIAEMGPTSYQDEDVIKYWAQQISSAQPISNGDIMPASTTATTAAIASTSSKSAYTMFKEATGSFLERWMDRHALPIIAKTISIGDIVRLSNDDDKFKGLIENIAINRVGEALDKSNLAPTQEEVMMLLEQEKEKLGNQPQILVKAVKKIVAAAMDTKVLVSNEEMDIGVTVQNLLQMLQVAPEYRDSTIKDIYDLMGLERPKLSKQPMGMPGMPGMPGSPASLPNATPSSNFQPPVSAAVPQQ